MLYDESGGAPGEGEVVVHDLNIPALGMAITEAVLTRWHKQPGDTVAVGEVIAEIETDKSNVDLESPAGGVLGPHLVGEGDVVPVGDPVARVLTAADSETSGPPVPPQSVLPRPVLPPDSGKVEAAVRSLLARA